MMKQIVNRLRTAIGWPGFASGSAWRGHPAGPGYYVTGAERAG